ncbi:MAG: ABC transporter substrate-binding protein [Propionibacteriaceae bacterium]|jgi:NitT/TauT family transport system substrate-binding protein|nr:ABC transporter substrate-binding protein [Propionibacteriaceae bacterium]
MSDILARMRRVMFGAVTVALLSTLTACTDEAGQGTASSTSTTRTTLTVGLTYQPDIQFAPFYVADALGWAGEAEHAIFQLRHHGMSESLFGALEVGTEDLVVAGGDEMYLARGEGVAVTAVMTMYQTYPVMIIGPADADPQLRAGLRIGIPGPYGENWYYLLAELAMAGLTPADVEIVNIGYTQQAALMTGRVDAVVGFVNNDVVRLERAGFPTRPIEALPMARRWQMLVGASVGVRDDLVTTSAQALQEYVDIIKRALEYIIEDPERAVDLCVQYIPGLDQPENHQAALDTLTATISLYGQVTDSGNVYDVLGTMDTGLWARQEQFLTEVGLTAGTPAEAAYTTVFAGERNGDG